MFVFPWRNRGDSPTAEGAPIVGEIFREDRITFGESRRTDRIGIIPTVPKITFAKLLRFPAEIGFFRLADLIGAIANELGVPFRHAEFPGHFGAAELALAFVPAAVHGPIPGERRAVFAHKGGLHTVGRPVTEPI